MYVYVGAYTEPQGAAAGIEVFRFDAGTGALSPVQTVAGVANPTWLALDDSQNVLFAANEEDDGRVSSFARDGRTGELRPINDQPAHGAPCYVRLDPSGQYVLAANYSGEYRLCAAGGRRWPPASGIPGHPLPGIRRPGRARGSASAHDQPLARWPHSFWLPISAPIRSSSTGSIRPPVN